MTPPTPTLPAGAQVYLVGGAVRDALLGLPVCPVVGAYVSRVLALPGVQDWITGALAEKDFLDFEEPYRLQR